MRITIAKLQAEVDPVLASNAAPQRKNEALRLKLTEINQRIAASSPFLSTPALVTARQHCDDAAQEAGLTFVEQTDVPGSAVSPSGGGPRRSMTAGGLTPLSEDQQHQADVISGIPSEG